MEELGSSSLEKKPEQSFESRSRRRMKRKRRSTDKTRILCGHGDSKMNLTQSIAAQKVVGTPEVGIAVLEEHERDVSHEIEEVDIFDLSPTNQLKS